MVLERFKLFGRGKTREQLRADGESQILKSDIEAIRIARDLLIMRELGKNEGDIKDFWNGLSKAEKVRYYERMKNYLLEFPSHLNENDAIALEIQRRLNERGRTVEHAIEGADYFASLGRGSGKVKEVKLQKFDKKPSGGGGKVKPVKPAEMPTCPVCSRLGRVYYLKVAAALRPVGPKPPSAVLHCGSCQTDFIINEHGHLVPYTTGEIIPEVCPVCGSKLMKMEDAVRKVPILMCTNSECRGYNGLQPWFREMTQGEYRQFMKARTAIYKPKFDMLKAAAQYNPNATDRKGRSTKAEIERMEDNVKNSGVTDINYSNLPKLLENLPAAEKAGWYDDYMKNMKRYGKIPDSEKKKAWFKGFKGFKERFEDQYGFHDEAYKRFEDDRDFKKEFDETAEAEAAKRSKEEREDENWMRRHKIDVAGNIRRNTTKAASVGILEVIGIVIGAIYGWPFLVAATCWALRQMLPDGKGYEMRKDYDKFIFGSLFATRQNRYSTGLGAMKSLLKVSALIFAGVGMFGTELPFRGLMLLAFFFAAYFSLPAEYSTAEPYKFLEGLGKPVIAIILAFSVFNGIFQSAELTWMCLAFFFIFPVATEKENLARAVGVVGSGTGAVYENLDKVIFIILMIGGYMAVMGTFGWGTINFDFLVGTEATVFFIFWLVGIVGGVMSPAATRPYTGVIMLAMVFFFYSSGAGEQIVGQGFFGAWWPTVHNTITSVTTPFGEVMGSLGETFGSTFKLLTNPTGFAKDIMEGSYEENPTGKTGAYGVEVNDLVVPPIQPGTLSMVTFTIKNEGPARAGDVKVHFGLPSYLKGIIAVGHGDDVSPEGISTDNSDYDGGDIEEFKSFEPSYTLPLLFMIDARDCQKINELESQLSRLSKRNEYVRVNVSVEYTYEVSSWIPVEIISVQEWQDRTAKGTFAPAKVLSHISTSPAKLSIGTFEQPIIAGNRPFYVGLNMTSEEGPNSEIIWYDKASPNDELTSVELEVPKGLTDSDITCSLVPRNNNAATIKAETERNAYIFNWTGSVMDKKSIYCLSTTKKDFPQPSETFYVRAKATFRFRKWVTADTLFTFGDVCPQELGIVQSETPTTVEEDAEDENYTSQQPQTGTTPAVELKNVRNGVICVTDGSEAYFAVLEGGTLYTLGDGTNPVPTKSADYGTADDYYKAVALRIYRIIEYHDMTGIEGIALADYGITALSLNPSSGYIVEALAALSASDSTTYTDYRSKTAVVDIRDTDDFETAIKRVKRRID